jgi:ABC-type transport system involved in cytochrome c biogenesis permease subunit
MKYLLIISLLLFPFLLQESSPPGAILPVQDQGRIKPLDTVARTSRVMISGKEGSAPSEWLLQLLFAPQTTMNQKMILNTYPDIFPEKYLSINQLLPHLNSIYSQITNVPTEEDLYQESLVQLWKRIELYLRLTHTLHDDKQTPLTPYFGITPPHDFDSDAHWKNIEEDKTGWKPFIQSWPNISEPVDQYLEEISSANPSLVRSLKIELFFNTIAPFFISKIYYLIALILFTFLTLFDKKTWPATYFLIAAFCLHTLGIILRMVIEGRPPVTNLYSSALFVGWGAILCALMLSKKYSSLQPVASLIGLLTLSISYSLSLSGDTLEMMRAVLDSNFWLSLHVITITLGYSATFLAGFLSAYALLFSKEIKSTATLVYRIISLALLLSFIGTLLGGIWADQSWGRFWGWDPKENGALMIVLWNTVILHLRVGGYIKAVGILRLAVFGNVITSFSWFGVNMLGVGLHSYGFIEQAFLWLIVFDVLNLLIICKPVRIEQSS